MHQNKSQERKGIESLQRQFEAVGLGDLAAYFQELHADMELEIHCPDILPFVRRAKGAQNVLEAVGQNYGSLENQNPEILSVVAQGNLVDVMLAETGRVKATQVPYDCLAMQQFQFDGGKVRKLRMLVALRSPEAPPKPATVVPASEDKSAPLSGSKEG